MNKKLKLWELERKTPDEFRSQQKFPIVIVLDDIRSLNNVGSFFRTADAFNIEQVVLAGITACPPHKDIRKTALGATETVRWKYAEQVIDEVKDLKAEGYTVCAIEQTEQTIFLQDVQDFDSKPYVLIFGNEVNGVRQELVDCADCVVEVPQFGTKHSLNVSVCAGIVLWEFCKRFME
tara:strand:+ start:327 stop:860 length:534 start_codon:yes stop_codon:yes gene_type:complete